MDSYSICSMSLLYLLKGKYALNLICQKTALWAFEFSSHSPISDVIAGVSHSSGIVLSWKTPVITYWVMGFISDYCVN